MAAKLWQLRGPGWQADITTGAPARRLHLQERLSEHRGLSTNGAPQGDHGGRFWQWGWLSGPGQWRQNRTAIQVSCQSWLRCVTDFARARVVQGPGSVAVKLFVRGPAPEAPCVTPALERRY